MRGVRRGGLAVTVILLCAVTGWGPHPVTAHSSTPPTANLTPSPSPSRSVEIPWTGSAFPSTAFSSATDYCFNHPATCFPSDSPTH